MILLPILMRELRARGHSPAQWWARAAVAGVGMLVSVPQLVWAGPLTSLNIAGRGAFTALVSAAFLLCCGACLLTADAVSREKREGTLPLLLLTRVHYWDILLGKLVSSSMACFTALLAFLPLLALPLLAGGTSSGETFRNSLALLNTLFLALALGLCVSSFGLDRFRTSLAALFLMAAFLLLPLLSRSHPRLASPLTAIRLSAGAAYNAAPNLFWGSLGLVQVFSWTLLAAAVVGLRTRPAEPDYTTGPKPDPKPRPWEISQPVRAPGVSNQVKCRYCGRRNSAEAVFCHECGTELSPKPVQLPKWTLASAASPLHWLLGRQRGAAPMLWIAAAIAACQIAVSVIVPRLIGPAMGAWSLGFYWGFGFITMAIVGGLIACAASREIIEARRTGALELLLTTPLGAAELVSTQWEIIKRMIRLPLVVMLAPSLLRGVAILAFTPGISANGYALSVLLTTANTFLSVGALCWLALWFAFQGVGQARTIFWTVLVAHGLPYFFTLAWAALLSPFRSSTSPLLLVSLIPQIATLLLYLALIRFARSRLRQYPGAEPLDLRHALRALS